MAENKALISFRNSIGKSQKEMAEILNVSLSFYIKIEHGLRNPSYNFVSKFKSNFPKANVDEIFFGRKLHEECGNKPTGTTG